MANTLLMPKATAVWLVDNTALTFEQIGAFCSLHALEVQGIADGDVATGVMGVNPTLNGQLTRKEIVAAEADPDYRLVLSEPKVHIAGTKKRGPRYTPISRRTERPNSIKWLVRNHPELKDAQIIRLVGTTKTTIAAVRDGTHWNNAGLTMMDPVTLGLCSQTNLDMEVRKANKDNIVADGEEEGKVRLMSAEEALGSVIDTESAGETGEVDPFAPADAVFGETDSPAPEQSEEKIDADAVFAKLSSLKKDSDKE
ncbi:MAG: DUF1013 domain-containing protein [Devosiaceae bacterium]|nr:DUF1013 domain-containing protein [Devosiaceae bacterium]